MYEIVRKKELAPNIKQLEVFAPLVARRARVGQFVILRVDERGERIPLTIVAADSEKGTVTIIFREVGRTTKKLGRLREGDYILDFVGPLGVPASIKKYGCVVCIGGGVGVAPIYPRASALKAAGNYVISIIGARTKGLLILEEEMREVSDELYVTTDDGSKGRKGFVSDVLRDLLETAAAGRRQRIDLVVAAGPVVMMKVVAGVTRDYGVKSIVSLNPIMVDGTGMCGSCRVTVGGEIKFACVHGPEFDAHFVDFDELLARNARYLEEERLALKLFEKETGRGE
ncbi:sulfide/dihydroorotate dehydrogenase-like FAD/NAD-binding protein [Candidatus Alkanophaga liquidiphilum]